MVIILTVLTGGKDSLKSLQELHIYKTVWKRTLYNCPAVPLVQYNKILKLILSVHCFKDYK